MPEMMIMLFTKPRLQGRDYWSKEGGGLVALPPRKCFNMSPLCGRGYGHINQIKVSCVVRE